MEILFTLAGLFFCKYLLTCKKIKKKKEKRKNNRFYKAASPAIGEKIGWPRLTDLLNPKKSGELSTSAVISADNDARSTDVRKRFSREQTLFFDRHTACTIAHRHEL